MSTGNAKKRASERAEAYAPKPTGGSVMAGVSVGAVAFGAIYGVLRFYDHRIAEYPITIAVMVVVSAAVGFISYKRAAGRHRRAVERELTSEDARTADDNHGG